MASSSSRFGNSESASGFIRTHSVLAIDNLPDSRKPFIAAKRRVFKNSSDLHTELSSIMPAALIRKEPDFRASTRLALYDAVWPAHRDHRLKTHIRVFEESNRF